MFEVCTNKNNRYAKTLFKLQYHKAIQAFYHFQYFVQLILFSVQIWKPFNPF